MVIAWNRCPSSLRDNIFYFNANMFHIAHLWVFDGPLTISTNLIDRPKALALYCWVHDGIDQWVIPITLNLFSFLTKIFQSQNHDKHFSFRKEIKSVASGIAEKECEYVRK